MLHSKDTVNQQEIKTVLLIGLGRIGLPQALILANSGITVYGFDHNASIMQEFDKGQLPFYEPNMETYLRNSLNKTFHPIASWEKVTHYLSLIDAVFFVVGTQAPNAESVCQSETFDLSAYFVLLDKLFSDKKRIKKGIKLIIRTTLPLGGTDRLKEHIETQHGLMEGQDFYFAFVPERIIEGNALEELKTIPKIIGVYSDEAFHPIQLLFKKIGGKVMRVRNPITAEFCKLTDNSFRSTVFSYANEIALHAHHFNINVNEVIKTVNDGYKRNHIPKPGFVSGYCLSKDPYIFELGFLKNHKRNFQSVWYYGCKANAYLIQFAVDHVLKNIKEAEHSVVAILGLSFKEEVDDFRMAHPFSIIEKLVENKLCNFKVYDPNLDKNKYTQIPEHLCKYIRYKSNVLDEKVLDQVDALIIATQHHSLVKMNTHTLLTQLVRNTKKPCYVFDGYAIWDQIKSIPNIRYESITKHN